MRLPEPGETLAQKYALHAVIGRGGFATVYRAEDLSLGRPVALKVLTPAADGYSPTLVARFEREARVLASLRDPHTVQLYEAGTSPEGLLFMAFELLEGMDLSELIGRGQRFDESTVAHVLRQLLAALREAHQAGLLHRDIKPSNVRIYAYGDDPFRAKLMDFGIARAAEAAGPALTRQGELVGTPRYMSPEQMAGGSLTPASDLYSVGMVAYEMLMGPDASPLEAIASGRPLAMDASPAFTAAINQLLRRDAQERPQTADAVLRALAGGAPTTAEPPTPQPTIVAGAEPRTVRRASTRSLLTVLVVLAVLLCAAVALVVALRRPANPPTPPDRVRPLPGIVTGGATAPTNPAAVAAAPDAGHGADAGQDAGGGADATAAAASGCGRPHPPGLRTMTDERSGESWVVYIPRDYDGQRRMPLWFVFGGVGVDPGLTLQDMKLKPFADREGIVLALPHRGLMAFEASDRSALVATLDASLETLCVDEDQIFALGHGLGGDAAMLLSCDPRVDAIATSSYRHTSAPFACGRESSIPYLHLGPLKSGYLPVDGGRACLSAQTVVSLADHEARWRERNACAGSRSEVSRHNKSVCYAWKCDEPFVSCHIDGGHGWSGRKRVLDLVDCDGPAADFPFLQTLWDFFQDA